MVEAARFCGPGTKILWSWMGFGEDAGLRMEAGSWVRALHTRPMAPPWGRSRRSSGGSVGGADPSGPASRCPVFCLRRFDVLGWIWSPRSNSGLASLESGRPPSHGPPSCRPVSVSKNGRYHVWMDRRGPSIARVCDNTRYLMVDVPHRVQSCAWTRDHNLWILAEDLSLIHI